MNPATRTEAEQAEIETAAIKRLRYRYDKMIEDHNNTIRSQSIVIRDMEDRLANAEQSKEEAIITATEAFNESRQRYLDTLIKQEIKFNRLLEENEELAQLCANYANELTDRTERYKNAVLHIQKERDETVASYKLGKEYRDAINYAFSRTLYILNNIHGLGADEEEEGKEKKKEEDDA